MLKPLAEGKHEADGGGQGAGVRELLRLARAGVVAAVLFLILMPETGGDRNARSLNANGSAL